VPRAGRDLAANVATMSLVGRYVKITANAGQGDKLAQAMLQVADSLRSTRGCELYVINRSPDDPDAVWVTELWLDQDALDASLEALRTEAGRAQMAEVMELVGGGFERIDLVPLGGVGLPGPDA
jgi:quinol monooxygenase YgiN